MSRRRPKIDLPISFSDEEIQALLDGKKNVFAVPAKIPDELDINRVVADTKRGLYLIDNIPVGKMQFSLGDTVRVVERWSLTKNGPAYAVGHKRRVKKWLSAETMPIWASRILLKVTNVSFCRYSDHNVVAQGVDNFDPVWDDKYPSHSAFLNPIVEAVNFSVERVGEEKMVVEEEKIVSDDDEIRFTRKDYYVHCHILRGGVWYLVAAADYRRVIIQRWMRNCRRVVVRLEGGGVRDPSSIQDVLRSIRTGTDRGRGAVMALNSLIVSRLHVGDPRDA